MTRMRYRIWNQVAMVMVSTQYKQELNHAKKTTAWEDKKEKFNPFVMTVRTITVQEEEYKNGDVLNIDKTEEAYK